jgi:hypothetical protein
LYQPRIATKPDVVWTRAEQGARITDMGVIADTWADWVMSAQCPARRRRRFRLGLVLFAIGLRRLAVRVAGVPTRSVDRL